MRQVTLTFAQLEDMQKALPKGAVVVYGSGGIEGFVSYGVHVRPDGPNAFRLLLPDGEQTVERGGYITFPYDWPVEVSAQVVADLVKAQDVISDALYYARDKYGDREAYAHLERLIDFIHHQK